MPGRPTPGHSALRLKQQVDELNEQMELRLGEIDGLRAKAAGERAIQDADPPVLAKIEFERYTGALDTETGKAATPSEPRGERLENGR